MSLDQLPARRGRKLPFLVRWGILALALWVSVQLVGGIEVDGGFWTYLWVALIVGFVNAVLGTLLKLFTFPLILLTFGLFTVVINAAMLEVTDRLLGSFSVDGFGSAFLGALVITITQMALSALVRRLD